MKIKSLQSLALPSLLFPLLVLAACGSQSGPGVSAKQAEWFRYSGALPDGSYGEEGGLRVIEIHQTACQFLEAEHYVDAGFKSASAKDCAAINEKTWSKRVDNARPLLVMQGAFILRITNDDVPYPVDFWIRPYDNNFTSGSPRIDLPEYRISDIKTGETKEIRVNLPRSFYQYSSPANGTPDYSILIYDKKHSW